MKPIYKISVIAMALGFMLLADVPLLPESVPSRTLQLVPEADAVLGVRRRTRRRTAVVVGTTSYAAGAASASAAASQEQAAAPPPQQAPAAAPPPPPPAPPPADTGKPLPLGTVVSALPAGCVPTPVGGVEYYYCGGNFYRAVFQGNQLVYVTTKPE
jgi:hypothetical protein